MILERINLEVKCFSVGWDFGHTGTNELYFMVR